MFENFFPSASSPQAVQLVRPQALGEVDYFMDLHDPRLAQFMRQGVESSAGVAVTSESAMRVSTVFSCVRIISGAIATIPLDIKRRISDKEREDADSEPGWRLFKRRPNRWMRPAQFRRMMQAHILLRGNAYCFKVKNFNSITVELLPLHPDRIKVSQNADLSLAYEYNSPSGEMRKFSQDQIFHLMGITQDGIRGMSVISYARETIGLSLATARHGSGFFRSGTQVGSVLKHPGKLGSEAQDTLRTSLEKYRNQEENAHKTLILEEGMDFNKLGMTAEDAQFVETMGLNRTEIAMFFGVPPHLLGDTEKNTSWGTGIEAQTRGFVAFSLEDWLTDWEEAVNADLLDYDEDLYAKFNRSALVRGDFTTRWNGYVKALQFGVFSPDEIRAFEDQNPRPDGKGGEYYNPPNAAGKVNDNPGGPNDGPQAP